MSLIGGVRSKVVVIAMFLLLSWLAPSLIGQTGGSGGGSGGAGARSGTAGSRSPAERRRGAQSRIPAQPAIVLVGNVVMDNGSPAPATTVIERVCFGRTRKEARVDARGSFSFRSEATTPLPAMLATRQGRTRAVPALRSSPGLDERRSEPMGGDDGLRTARRLPGYRSSVIYLKGAKRLARSTSERSCSKHWRGSRERRSASRHAGA